METMPDISRIIEYLDSFEGISYGVYSLPVEKLYIFGNADSLKLVAFSPEIEESGLKLPFPVKDNPQISAAMRFLELYMRAEQGPLPRFDLGIFTEKEKAVYRALLKVPFGKTISYGVLAGKAGISHGGRFVGNAMAKNIFPVFIPCHRVIRSGGEMGNYSGGVHIKEFLLGHELKKK